MYGKSALILALALVPLAGLSATEASDPALSSTEWTESCTDWDEWDKPAPPFLIHGSTYYVGTCGIASLLIETDAGLVPIDTGTEAGADVVRRSIPSNVASYRGVLEGLFKSECPILPDPHFSSMNMPGQRASERRLRGRDPCQADPAQIERGSAARVDEAAGAKQASLRIQTPTDDEISR